jgi:outer membrane protein assembly factor BamB
MNLDDHARASAQGLLGSVARVDPVASLDQLLRRRRRRLAGRAALALATATMVAVVAWVGIRELQPPAIVTQPGSLGRVTATIPVGGDPVDVLVSQGAVWVAAGQGTVSRIDPATGTTTSRVAVGPRPRLAAGFGSIWAANNDPSGVTVSRIDARTGQLAATIPISVTAPAVKPTQLAVGAGAVWVIASNIATNQLLRIDPATNQATPVSTVGEFMGSGIAVAGGLVWISGRDDSGVSQLLRVNPTTNRIADPLPTDGDGALTAGGGSLWQAGIATQTIYRLDPKSGRKLAEIPIGVVPQQLTAGDGSPWVGSPSGRVTRIDMATNTVTGTFQVTGPAPAAAAGLGAVWIADTAKAAVLRVQPTG